MRLTRKGYYPQTEQILNRNCAKQKRRTACAILRKLSFGKTL